MEAKDTPFWKFLLGKNLFKRNQVRSVEWNGSELVIEVQSGTVTRFSAGQFTAKFIKTSEGNRDFTIKSQTKPVQKVVIRETLLQMPESWWDDLANRIGAAESGLSKVLHAAKDFTEDLAESGSFVDAAISQIPLDDNTTTTHSQPMTATPQTPQQQKPKRSGCMTALMIIGGLVVLLIGGCAVLTGIFAVGVSEVAKEEAAKTKIQLDSLATASPSGLRPDGELERMFTMLSEHTDIQRENKEKEITGKIVEWTLSVYEVSRSGENYRVQTHGDNVVGTFTILHPRSDSDRKRIEALKENDVITVRGYITGTSLRSVDIDPAILVR